MTFLLSCVSLHLIACSLLCTAYVRSAKVQDERHTRVKRNFYLYNVHQDKIDLVISPNRRWPAEVKVGVMYWEKDTQESKALPAIEPTDMKTLYKKRIQDGPLMGYRRGVTIYDLQPGTTYNVKEVVYVKRQEGDQFVEKKNLERVTSYTTLPGEQTKSETEIQRKNTFPKDTEEGLKPLA